MEETTAGTSGGCSGTDGGRLLAARALLVLLPVGTLVQVSVNAASRVADDPSIPAWQHWGTELTSGAAILMLLPWLWFIAGRLWPQRLGWPRTIAGHVGAAIAFSLAHVALMIVFRRALWGDWYDPGPLTRLLPYELRKDAWSYALLMLLAMLSHWLAQPSREVSGDTSPRPAMLVVQDGTTTTHVPLDEIDAVEAAGNYVEIAWGQRRLLHRATLAATEEVLGPGFVRIHRSRILRRAAVRRVETNQAGDFTVELVSGARLRGSRRYRTGLESRPPSP